MGGWGGSELGEHFLSQSQTSRSRVSCLLQSKKSQLPPLSKHSDTRLPKKDAGHGGTWDGGHLGGGQEGLHSSTDTQLLLKPSCYNHPVVANSIITEERRNARHEVRSQRAAGRRVLVEEEAATLG